MVLSVLLGAQASASGAPSLVCKYTGKVMTGCPCPDGADGEGAKLQREDCCVLRAAAPVAPAVPVALTALSCSASQVALPALLPLDAPGPSPDLNAVASPSPTQFRRQRLSISLRQLLI